MGQPFERGVKWYRKLRIEIFLGISIVNAHVLYQEIKERKIKTRKFREDIASALLGVTTERNVPNIQHQHVLEALKTTNNKEIF